jgi:hypothetical protein
MPHTADLCTNAPLIGLNRYILVADSDAEATAIA